MKDAGLVYIFGTTFDGNWQDGDVADVVLAAATPENIQKYSAWLFYNSAGIWKPFSDASLNPPTPQNLGKVAIAGNPYFSVEKVTVNSLTRYVMIQSTPDGSNKLLMRIGKVNGAGTPLKLFYNLPNPLVSDTKTFVAQIAGSSGFDPPCDNSRLVVHAMGHKDLSPPGNQLMVSYYCQLIHHNDDKWPNGTPNHDVTPRDKDNPLNNFGTCTETTSDVIDDFLLGGLVNVYDRPGIRYHLIDMALLRPWCTAGLQYCWMP